VSGPNQRIIELGGTVLRTHQTLANSTRGLITSEKAFSRQDELLGISRELCPELVKSSRVLLRHSCSSDIHQYV
jgi:hypothetical protein